MTENDRARNIIITEKADAARRIAYILSDGSSKQKRSKGLNYIEFGEGNGLTYVIPLSGHIIEIDFPEKYKDWRGSDLNEIIGATIERKIKNRSAFNSLVSLSGFSQRIVVATDFDREGELIGVEALDIVKENVLSKVKSNPDILRARFSSL
ncbi:MAG: toprim domain-containing protein, partial [Candidatus Thermoplasmatota archaeon]|nr:toprim domain-containing protein [Candidatus Thermoplasmatota archaeon]